MRAEDKGNAMRKMVLLAMACLLVAGGWAVAGGVPDTGIDFCTDGQQRIPCPQPGEPFYGQDANYQGNARSYTKLGMGWVELPDSATQEDGWLMTRDNVTGLVWELKNNSDDTPDYTNPNDFDNIYTWCTDGIGNCDEQDTTDFIADINTTNYGGFNDWRMPTLLELFSLVNHNLSIPTPTIDSAFFPLTEGIFWSSFPSGADSDKAITVNFNYGDVTTLATSNRFSVRAVRRGGD